MREHKDFLGEFKQQLNLLRRIHARVYNIEHDLDDRYNALDRDVKKRDNLIKELKEEIEDWKLRFEEKDARREANNAKQ